jgi:hypothetical protein
MIVANENFDILLPKIMEPTFLAQSGKKMIIDHLIFKKSDKFLI